MKQNLAVAARFILGGIFILSGFHHAVNPPQEFAAIVESYMYLQPESILTFATYLPWAELFFGVFILAGYQTKISSVALAIMLAMFETAIYSAKSRGVPLDHCGCFGQSIPLTPTQTMAMDAALLGLTVLAFKWGRDRLSADHWVDEGAR